MEERENTYRHLNISRFLIPAVCLTLCAAILGSLYYLEKVRPAAETVPNRTQITQEAIVFPEFPETVLLCSDVAKRGYDHEVSVETENQADDPYRSLVLEYNIGDRSGTVVLSEHADFSDPITYALEPYKYVLRIDNLKTGTRYHYKVTVADQVETGHFFTEPSTRFVSIPGAYITRDIGGYQTLDGKTVRQGLLIRGTEIDGLEYEQFALEEYAVDDVQNTFGFVYDFDLRAAQIYDGENYQSPLGADVGHAFYEAPEYEVMFGDWWKEQVRVIFANLADPEKYPMYMHCTWGKDRTGTIVFLLQGVLNMSEEDMLREYYLSGYLYTNMSEQTGIYALMDGLQPYAGETLQEKIVSYLTEDAGVTEEEIQSIREIFLAP